MRTLALSALTAALLSGFVLPAQAAKTTTQPGRVAKDAFAQQRGHRLDHAHEVYSFNAKSAPAYTGSDRQFVLGWKGPTKGPGAKSVYAMVVPFANDRAGRLAGTKISGNLAREGQALVRAHLDELGLGGKIQLGDHMKTSPRDGQRLKQAPVTRDSGFLRYTVTQKDGSQRRYLVWTNPAALSKGRGEILGKVQADTDWYRAQ